MDQSKPPKLPDWDEAKFTSTTKMLKSKEVEAAIQKMIAQKTTTLEKRVITDEYTSLELPKDSGIVRDGFGIISNGLPGVGNVSFYDVATNVGISPVMPLPSRPTFTAEEQAEFKRQAQEVGKKMLAEYLGSESARVIKQLQDQIDQLKEVAIGQSQKIAALQERLDMQDPDWGKF